MALLLVLMFAGGITWARVSGNWQNDISHREYLRFAGPAVSPQLPGGMDMRNMDPEKMKRMLQIMEMMQRQRAQQGIPMPPVE